MKKRKLGRTDLECSEIGLGTWALGSLVYGKVDREDSRQLVQGSIDKGINFFDTAPLYGMDGQDGVAETVLGESLGTRRGDVIISTKFGRTATQVMPPRFTADEVKKSCEASLRRLGREWIDLMFFHSPFEASEIQDDVWDGLARLREEGKIRYIGHSVSMYQDTRDMSAQWMQDRKIDVVQVVLSPFNREARPLIETAIEENCGVVARECLANGFLSGGITKDTVFPEGSLNARYSREEIGERADYANALQNTLVKGEVATLPEATYRWILDQPGVSLALSGAKNATEIEGVIRASEINSYEGAVLAEAERIHKKDFCPA